MTDSTQNLNKTLEAARLQDLQQGKCRWQTWGPYLSERQWGTVREDYSENSEPWDYFSHDQARSRAYRWGEDGLAGFSDYKQRVCLGLALWNERDAILKERLFGLTNAEGNHGEDVKELYYFLEATPSHSYLKMLYKYPQAEFPYQQLVEENAQRTKRNPEFELLDTQLFAEQRYFDVFVEYAQNIPGEIFMRVTAHNRGPDAAPLHIIPHVWLRNEWSWDKNNKKPKLERFDDQTIQIDHERFGRLYCSIIPNSSHSMNPPINDSLQWLFSENETNKRAVFVSHGQPHARKKSFYKDGFHNHIINRQGDAVNPEQIGTKACAWLQQQIAAGESVQIILRLGSTKTLYTTAEAAAIFAERIKDADDYYATLQADIADSEARNVQRQALAGMIWSKQFYYFNVRKWIDGDPDQPPPPSARKHKRNSDWLHLNCADIISMPDSWEYPWFAAWDLAFHCIPLALIDAEFAKHQLALLARMWYLHPNGQLPAYEWNFSDVNPPVHAWACWRVYQMDRKHQGHGDREFLEHIFHKLLLNFTWWVNRKDTEGRNIFQGGFLGLDNIGVFDRSKPLPTGGYINQADGTSWMAMYCLNMMHIAMELAQENPIYEEMATKFFEHFLDIAEAMNNLGQSGAQLWDEQDKFFYDVLCTDSGDTVPLKVRSLVGLIPLFAVEVLEPETLDKLPNFKRRMEWVFNNRPELCSLVSRWHQPGRGNRILFALLRGHRMKAVLRRMLDETEFLSDYGIRALSRHHLAEPYVFDYQGTRLDITYEPAESPNRLFGGNSNWRGPIWFPVNYLMIESLQKFHHYYGDDFKIECPSYSGNFKTIGEVAEELTHRLTRIFLPDAKGERPTYGQSKQLQQDPHFNQYLMFFEYFHGDSGLGLGANHQTGWTGLIAKLLQPRGK